MFQFVQKFFRTEQNKNELFLTFWNYKILDIINSFIENMLIAAILADVCELKWH